jgi:heme-degrading monooxygenase HmoA
LSRVHEANRPGVPYDLSRDMPDTEQPSIVVDAWRVADGDQEEFIDALVGLFSRLRELDGFIDGEILRGVDPTRFVTYARMRSASERDAAFIDSELRGALRMIRRMARPDPGAYTVFRKFTAEGPSA